jgi:hypothetical protein
MKRLLCLLFPALLLAGCSQTVAVVADKKDRSRGRIVLDGKEAHDFRDSVLRLQLSTGVHTVSLNGEPPRRFYVPPGGGLLNLDGQAYVAYQVKYVEQGTGRQGQPGEIRVEEAVILIDSFLVEEGSMSYLQPDSIYTRYARQLYATRNGNYYPMSELAHSIGLDYDSSTEVFGLKRFGAGQLFVARFWDYDPGEAIPESVPVLAPADHVYAASGKKLAVFGEQEFLQLALALPDQFVVRKVLPQPAETPAPGGARACASSPR